MMTGLTLQKLLEAHRLLSEAQTLLDKEQLCIRLQAQSLHRTDLPGSPSTSSLPGRVDRLETLLEQGLRFGAIYADPPWSYDNNASRGAAANHYPCMATEEIAALPIAQLAADRAHLHLWTTNAFLFDALNVLQTWGFSYKSMLVWIKPQLGAGNYWRVSHEFLLLGVRGNQPFADKAQQSWICTDRTHHSSKPAVVRRIIEAVSPPPRLELFSRSLADGWTVWGNQIEPTLFDEDDSLLEQQEAYPNDQC